MKNNVECFPECARIDRLLESFLKSCNDFTYLLNEVHQKETISRILWYSDWLHNTTFTGNSIVETNHNATSGRRTIM